MAGTRHIPYDLTATAVAYINRPAGTCGADADVARAVDAHPLRAVVRREGDEPSRRSVPPVEVDGAVEAAVEVVLEGERLGERRLGVVRLHPQEGAGAGR